MVKNQLCNATVPKGEIAKACAFSARLFLERDLSPEHLYEWYVPIVKKERVGGYISKFVIRRHNLDKTMFVFISF
jgi:hypothetical protein